MDQPRQSPTNKPSDQPRFHLVLRSEALPVPAVLRLRRLLKVLKRAYGFQCLMIEEVSLDPSTPRPDATGASVDAYACYCGLCDPLEKKGHRPRVP
jgi:hypothetical protein